MPTDADKLLSLFSKDMQSTMKKVSVDGSVQELQPEVIEHVSTRMLHVLQAHEISPAGSILILSGMLFHMVDAYQHPEKTVFNTEPPTKPN